MLLNQKIQPKLYMALFAAIFFAPAIFSSTQATASKYKLKCDGQYQLVQGNWISTTPCEESYLAKIARSYGVRVTVKQIRNNPNKKIEICEFLNHDTRVQNLCGAYGNHHFSYGH